ncbi:hypothetical protein [Azospirillum argentinense]|uniref:Phage Mu protein F like protein n=2 Tax=Azospirillum TaxID=191 RepID=A0A4D8QAK4_AZOBR|nr:hypothetical protein [Azospirillum argentinense]QCO00568.1 hypothetical protein D3093_35595 [Azospirillum argentinense]QCO07405.1 hypothetical protein D3867_36645 [Azospirillum argentinense]
MPLPHSYLEDIAARLEPGMREAFLKAVRALRAQADPARIAALLENGDVDGVLDAIGLNDPAWLNSFRAAMAEGFVAGGQETHAGVRGLIIDAISQDILPPGSDARLLASFGIRNLPAEKALRDYGMGLIREIDDNTRDGVRTFLEDGMEAGRNPVQSALDLCGRIGESGEREGGILGLTETQARSVQRARDELASTDAPTLRRYLGRELRDRRYDAAVLRAIRSGEPIPEAIQEKAGTAYSNRYLRYRAEVMSRTESLRSASVGQHAALLNAVATGALPYGSIRRFWMDTDDERTRVWHKEIPDLNPDGVSLEEPFVTPLGPLLYPRDPEGEAENIIQCRCWMQIRLTGSGNRWLDMLAFPVPG